MGFADANCPHGFNALVMKNIITKNIHSYKHERIQVIGPACGGLFNWYVGFFPTSTYIWFYNQAFLAIRRTNLDVKNQPIVYEFRDSSASPFGSASPVFRSQFRHPIEVHRSMGLI
jgi:hypothetical protein